MKHKYFLGIFVTLCVSVVSCHKAEPDTSIDVTFSRDTALVVSPSVPITMTYKIVSATGEGKLELLSYNGIKEPTIFPTATDPMSGKIQFEILSTISEDAYAEFRISNSAREVIKRFTFEPEAFDPEVEIRKSVAAAGGTVDFDFLSNVDYVVQIPDEAKSWITTVSTKAMKSRTVSLSVAANDGVSREAWVKFKSKISTNFIYCRVAQEGVGNKLSFKIDGYTYSAPGFSGSNIAASIDWGDGNGIQTWSSASKIVYQDGLSEHTVSLESQNASAVNFESLTGLKTLDLSKF